MTELLVTDRLVSGIRVRDLTNGVEEEIRADLVVNATGPWAEQLAVMAGCDVPIRPSPGVLLAVRGRWCNMVVNRLHPSGDGDIVVPAARPLGGGHQLLGRGGPGRPRRARGPRASGCTSRASKMIPAIRHARSAGPPGRPRVRSSGRRTPTSGRELSRTFKCFDHRETDGVEGFVTISGGKGTTLRAMAETTADVICRKIGVEAPCRTREVVTLPHTAYYAA